MIDRRLLDEMIPYLEKNVGFKTYHVANGVLMLIVFHCKRLSVFSPMDEG